MDDEIITEFAILHFEHYIQGHFIQGLAHGRAPIREAD